MTKMKLKLRLVAAIAICLAGITVFSGCEKKEDPNNNNGNTEGTPKAVMNFTAMAGNGQVSLSWDAPTDNGVSEITGYEITCDNWANKVTKTASERSHTYTGLTNGTEYTFKVRAINANGAGAESTATATPTTGGSNEPLGEWSVPENLKVSFYQSTHNSEITTIKIGEDYYSICPNINLSGKTEELYYKYKPETDNWTAWQRHPDLNSGNWRVIPYGLSPISKSEIRTRVSALYWNMTYRTGFTHVPVIGTDVVAGRPVEIRADNSKIVKRYYDIEHKLALKSTSYDGENVMLEVKLWDETVTDFGGIDLPE